MGTTSKSRVKSFKSLTTTQIIAVLVAVAICTISFFLILSRPREKENAHLETSNAVPQVEHYIKKNILKDSERLEIIHWSKLIERTALDMLAYRVGVVYKIKKPNGNFRMESKVFDLDNNKNVMFEVDVPPFGGMQTK